MNELLENKDFEYDGLSEDIEKKIGTKLDRLKTEIKTDNYQSVLANSLDSFDLDKSFEENVNVDELRTFLAVDMIGQFYKDNILNSLDKIDSDPSGMLNDWKSSGSVDSLGSFINSFDVKNFEGNKKKILEWLKKNKDTELVKELGEEYNTIKKDVKSIIQGVITSHKDQINMLRREVLGQQVNAQEVAGQNNDQLENKDNEGFWGLFIAGIAGKIGFFRGDGGFFSRTWTGIKHAGVAGLSYLGINKFKSTDFGKDMAETLSNEAKNFTSWIGGFFNQKVQAADGEIEDSLDSENSEQTGNTEEKDTSKESTTKNDEKYKGLVNEIKGVFSDLLGDSKEAYFDKGSQSFVVVGNSNQENSFNLSIDTKDNQKTKIDSIQTDGNKVTIKYYTKTEKYPLKDKETKTISLTKDQFEETILSPHLDENNNNYETNIEDNDGNSLDVDIKVQTLDENDKNNSTANSQLNEVLYSSREKLNSHERSNIDSLSKDINNINHNLKDKLGSGKTPESLGDINLDKVGSIDKGFLAMLDKSKDYNSVEKLLASTWSEKWRDNIRNFADMIASFLIERSDTFLIGDLLGWMGSELEGLKDMVDSGEDKAQEIIAKKLEDKIKNSEDAKDKIQDLSEQFRFLRFSFKEQEKVIQEFDSLNDAQKSRKIQELKKKKISDSFEDMKLSNQTKFELGASGEVQNLIEELNSTQSASEKAERGYGSEDMNFDYKKSELRSYDKSTVIKMTHNGMYEVGKSSGVYVDSIKQAIWLANLTNKLDKMGNDHRHDGIDGRIRSEWDFKLTWKVKEIIERQHVMVYSSTLDEKVPSLDKTGWDKYIEFLNKRT